MVKRRKEQEDRLVSASQVAEIWNERAKQMGYPDTHYTRFSVRQRRNAKKNNFKPEIETEVGGLYRESEAWKIPIYPERSRRNTLEDLEQADVSLGKAGRKPKKSQRICKEGAEA